MSEEAIAFVVEDKEAGTPSKNLPRNLLFKQTSLQKEIKSKEQIQQDLDEAESKRKAIEEKKKQQWEEKTEKIEEARRKRLTSQKSKDEIEFELLEAEQRRKEFEDRKVQLAKAEAQKIENVKAKRNENTPSLPDYNKTFERKQNIDMEKHMKIREHLDRVSQVSRKVRQGSVEESSQDYQNA